MKIRIYKLNTCHYCNDTIEKLKQAGYVLSEIDVDNPANDAECAKLEKFFNSGRYPKLIVESGKNTYFINPDEGSRISSIGSSKFIYYNSVNDILNTVNQIKNHEI